METIIVYLQERPFEWRQFVFEIPPDACALVEAGLKKILAFSPHEDYAQFIYEIGGGYPMFFVACHLA